MVVDFKEIQSWIKDDALLLANGTKLDSYSKSFPQVSVFRTLSAKYAQLKGDSSYRELLKLAAIYSPNRKLLHQYIIQPRLSEVIEKVEAELNIPEETPASALEGNQNISTELSTKEEQDKKHLEQEILMHAVSSSILIDAELPLEAEEQNTEENQVIEIQSSSQPEINLEEFNKQSVLDWLKADDTTISNPQDQNEMESADSLISNFIKNDPGKIEIEKEERTFVPIERPKQEFFSPENMAKMSLIEDENFVTETLAGIYAKQGNLSKAKKAYQKLSLKFPEKSDYFARLIQELGNKH